LGQTDVALPRPRLVICSAGLAVGAALALECRFRGLEPFWPASNEASCRLAEKLRYTRLDGHETLEIVEKPGD